MFKDSLLLNFQHNPNTRKTGKNIYIWKVQIYTWPIDVSQGNVKTFCMHELTTTTNITKKKHIRTCAGGGHGILLLTCVWTSCSVYKRKIKIFFFFTTIQQSPQQITLMGFPTALTICIICFTGLSLKTLPQELLLLGQILFDKTVLAHFLTNLNIDILQEKKNLAGAILQSQQNVPSPKIYEELC